MADAHRHRVVIVGGGFGGIQAAHRISRGAPVDITLVDRRNFHLFQPLSYQVATGALSPGEICYPLRAIFKRRANVRVLLAEVAGFDLDAPRACGSRRRPATRGPMHVPYDTLIVAGGSQLLVLRPRRVAAVRARGQVAGERARRCARSILSAFEAAEMEPDAERRRAWLTFVVVGAGPTGVEMAGQIAELARDTLRRDFRAIDPRDGADPADRGRRPRADRLPAVAVAQGRARRSSSSA